MHRAVPFVLLVLFSFVTTGCDKELLGLPRVPLSVMSPDGSAEAFVRNHPNIDPPSQSVWLRVGNSSKRLRNLGPDSDWCNTIVWSGDGSTVAYLVQDARLLTTDRASGQIVSERWLTEWKGEYPPYRVVLDLTLSADGKEARFRDCARPVRYGFDGAGNRGHQLRDCIERRLSIRQIDPPAV
jgi:hypothetical protein